MLSDRCLSCLFVSLWHWCIVTNWSDGLGCRMPWLRIHYFVHIVGNSSLIATRPLSCVSVCNVGVLWPNGLMDQDATWYGGRPRLRRHCVRRGASSPRKGAQQLPHFSVSFTLARWPISATAELLFYWKATACIISGVFSIALRQWLHDMLSSQLFSLIDISFTYCLQDRWRLACRVAARLTSWLYV